MMWRKRWTDQLEWSAVRFNAMSVHVFDQIAADVATHHTHTHTQHTTVLRLCGICPGQPGWAGTRRNIHPLHPLWSSIIPIFFLHLLRHTASSVFNPRALQSFSTISLQVFFGLPLGLVPPTLYSIHFFTQSLSSFRSTCPYHRNLFRCSTEIMSSNWSLPLNSLLGTLSCNFTPHIHLTILISALWSATSFSFLTGQVSQAHKYMEMLMNAMKQFLGQPRVSDNVLYHL